MDIGAKACSRRVFGKLLLWAGLCRGAAEKSDGADDPLRWDDLAGDAHRTERQYRADAQILLLGMSIYRRNSVGGGRAVWAEAGGIRRKLEFAGFSDPQRAAGLNRFGFIQEVSSSQSKEFSYFGLMTSSPEETMESARKALRSSSGEIPFTAIGGRLREGGADALVAQFSAPATLARDQGDLIHSARKALGATGKQPLEFDPRATAAQPFLHSLFAALRGGSNSTTYVYGSRLYSLRLRSAADEKASAAFRQMKLLPAGGIAVKVSGKIRRAAGGKESEFRIWVQKDASHPVPLRIEYRPKAYLGLTFEAVSKSP